jgi:hypothetical protein
MSGRGANHRREGHPSLDLLEEAAGLLRADPLSVLVSYYLGTVPFVLGALYFWADMSRSAFAAQRLAGAALGMGCLYVWMKFWQAIFLQQLRCRMSQAPAPSLNGRRLLRTALRQTTLQPTGLFFLPLALLLIFPFGWVFAFYQNLTAMEDGEASEVLPLIRCSARQAWLWPGQNHALLGVLLVFGLVVFLNWGMVCYLAPVLAKALLGIESAFTRHDLSVLNSTFLAAVAGLTYLSVDPLAKAAYALRCFYGESLTSGEDLRSELRRFALTGRRLAVVLVLWLPSSALVAGAASPSRPEAEARPAGTVAAAPAVRGTADASIPAPDLDRAIQKTAQQRKYTWRAPRDQVVEEGDDEPGLLLRFLKRTGKLLAGWLESFARWVGNWVRKLFGGWQPSAPDGLGYRWILFQEILMYTLVATALAGLAFVLVKVWRNRHRVPQELAVQAVAVVPDLRDENLDAGQLPEDGWIRVARELLARNELRLALRAFHLASLAQLAGRNLIRVARFKSNRDYETELRGRAHGVPLLAGLFAENVSVFDRCWYGLQEVPPELVEHFALNVERMKEAA